MRQNDHNTLSSQPRLFFSLSFARIVQATACVAALGLSLGAVLPVNAQGSTATAQEKKTKKKTTTPPKTTPTKTPMEAPRVVFLFPRRQKAESATRSRM